MQQAQIFLYANGKKNPPTAVDFDRSLFRDFLFNQSPPKVNLKPNQSYTGTTRFDYWTNLFCFIGIGPRISLGIHETDPVRTGWWKASRVGEKLRLYPTVLHQNHGRLRCTGSSPGGDDQIEPTRTSFPAQRIRSRTVFLPASVFEPNPRRDISING